MENIALLKCYSAIVAGGKSNDPLLSVSYDEFSGIFKMDMNSNSEEFSLEFLLLLFNTINEYYTSTSVEKNQKTYGLIASKTDSLSNLVASKEYQLARAIDSKQNIVLAMSKLEEMRLTKDIEILYKQLGEAVKNREMAEFSLLNNTPFIQEIDLPIYPLQKKKPSLMKNLIIGGFLGLFLSVLFIVGRKILKDAMAEEN